MKVYYGCLLRGQTPWHVSYEGKKYIGVGSFYVHAFGLRLEVYW